MIRAGHCHPKILEALVTQAQTVSLTSRAFYNDIFPRFAKYATEYFGYDMILPMNTGAEGVETALKLARKWGYQKVCTSIGFFQLFWEIVRLTDVPTKTRKRFLRTKPLLSLAVKSTKVEKKKKKKLPAHFVFQLPWSHHCRRVVLH